MEYKKLGRSGLEVSALGLGCNNFGRRCDQEQTSAVVGKAIELGITFFDTADIYGPRGLSEEYLGKALEGRRHEVTIATKFAGPMGEGPLWGGGSRRYIIQAVDASLKRLNTDYIDLYQMHFPDRRTPIEETMRALDDVVRSGKARYIGCSNYDGWQVVEAQWFAKVGAHNAVHLGAEPVQPARPPHRTRARARLQRLRPWRAAVLPAGERLPERQV